MVAQVLWTTLFLDLLLALLSKNSMRPNNSMEECSSLKQSYSNADWAGNIDDRKSATGGCFYIGNNLVS
ncbi:unnamed protein product [Prunus armeniaca]